MSGNGIRVELYARESLPSKTDQRRQEIEQRLTDLAESGAIAGVDSHTWRKKVPLAADCLERERYDQFAAWAAQMGVDLDPFFATRECYETGEKREWLVVPAICLAVYREDRLQSVSPHATTRETLTVMDCLDAIESQAFDDPPSESTTDLLEAAD